MNFIAKTLSGASV